MESKLSTAQNLARVDLFLSRLDHVKTSRNGWTARCPAHDDRENSLSVGVGADGRALLNCFAGCDYREILKVLGLAETDLFADAKPARRARLRSKKCEAKELPDGITLAQYAELKKLPLSFLKEECECGDAIYHGNPAVTIPYFDTGGSVAAIQYRTGSAFRWRTGDTPILYGLQFLPMALEYGYAMIVEGASDVHTLLAVPIEPAFGVPGASNFKDEFFEALEEVPAWYVAVEPDAGGNVTLGFLLNLHGRYFCSSLRVSIQMSASSD
jgi:hypothetical protein